MGVVRADRDGHELPERVSDMQSGVGDFSADPLERVSLFRY